MNFPLISSLFRANREYNHLKEFLQNELNGGRIRVAEAAGLTRGTTDVFIPTLVGDFPGTSVLVICPEDKDAAETGALLEAAGIRILRYPARDFNFNNVTASHEFEHTRLKVLSTLLFDEEPAVIVTTPEALLQRTIPQSVMAALTVTVDPAQTLDLTAFCEKLTEAGYVRGDRVEGEGQFAVRGGIIDIFPPSGTPYRIELFGDEIDRIGVFDPDTQRLKESVTGLVRLSPAREVLINAKARKTLTDMIRKQIKKVTSSAEFAESNAPEVLRSEETVLENGLDPDFADKYIPFLYKEETCLLDYFKGILIVRDEQQCAAKADACANLLYTSVKEMALAGEFPPLPGDAGYVREWSVVDSAATRLPTVIVDSLNRPANDKAEVFTFDVQHIPAYSGNLGLLGDDLPAFVQNGYAIAILCATEPEKETVMHALMENGYSVGSADEGTDWTFFKATPSGKRPIGIIVGDFSEGFALRSPKFALMNFSASRRVTKRARTPKAAENKNAKAILSYADLKIGDLVVHPVHGIGRFMGIETRVSGGIERDFISVNYAGTDKLFIPVERLDLIAKYIGADADSGDVKLSHLGGSEWERAKARTKAAVKELAHELISLYAKRKAAEGIAFAEDDDMCRQFANAFPYEETQSQTAAIEDIRRDMEEPCPMDRLLCGDVGFGKTEVALRAAFKAVASGYQVAVLVPTTILAFQHFQTFQSRMRGFPVTVDMLSRFRSPQEQALIARKVRRGEIDVIIGTHRLISKDIVFHKLGLIIVDEEQRFGVEQKEKLKALAPNADILTLTATPIPRTLNMAMNNILDMSLLQEAPGMRSPVQTYVMEHDDGILLEAMRRELRRGGQVFYLQNRIEAVMETAHRIAAALPDACVEFAHGQMDREKLEEIWSALVRGDIDILVSTTIIETGIDVPNANTLIIENADRYGLSQLHQIRGRVGRSSRRAYAFLTYKRGRELTEVAQSRLEAIKEFTAFGAGFRIALRDLEIRGAGNLLGAQQHGHLDSVGYDMYIQLLNEAILEEQGKPLPVKKECSASIREDAFLPKNYIPDSPQRMEMYKKIACIEEYADYEDIIDELCDRFGEPPATALSLCRIVLARALAVRCGISKIVEIDGAVRFELSEIYPNALTILDKQFPRARIRLEPGKIPSLSALLPKTEKTTDFICEFLDKFVQILEAQQPSSGGQSVS